MAFKVLLIYFGWIVIIAGLAMVLVPYFRRTRDLMSGWSLFMIGCVNFIGIASVQSGTELTHAYVQPQDSDYVKFVAGGVIFLMSAAITYFYFQFPDRMAGRMLRRWGQRSPRVLFMMVPVCLLLALGRLFILNVQVVGQFLVDFGVHGPTIATAFCLICWFQRPRTAIYPLTALLCLIVAATVSNSAFGRRDFLAVMVTIPLTWYWMRGRYLPPGRVVAAIGISILVGFMAIAGVSVARFQKSSPDANIITAAWAKLTAIPDAFKSEGSTSGMLGGDAVDASLATIRLYDRIQPTQPFFTLEYVASQPVPRAWWPDKPLALGYTLPLDIGWSQIHGAVNLGPGIIGHGWHEGGLLMHVFYGCFFAFILRVWDWRMRRDPDNPYMIAILSCSSGQLLAFARGDIALFSTLILGAFVTGELISFVARLAYGTEQPVAAAGAQDQYPQASAYDYGVQHAGATDFTF